jgi:hypothetical protein
MTRVLLLAAAIGLTVSSAGACEYLKSVQAKTDPAVVASISNDKMSTAEDVETSGEKVIVEEKTE